MIALPLAYFIYQYFFKVQIDIENGTSTTVDLSALEESADERELIANGISLRHRPRAHGVGVPVCRERR